MQRVNTGVPGLDEILNGGYRRNRILTITGNAGCGKTTFVLQYLWAGATKYNEPGVFVTFEEEKKLLFENVGAFGWELEKLEAEHKLEVFEYPPYEVERFVNQESIIRDVIDEIGAKRMVVDSITSLGVSYSDEHERRYELVKLLTKFRKWNCTMLITSESEHMSDDLTIRARFDVDTLTDGIIYLYNIRKGDVRQRALEVIKMRGTNFEQKICPMRFMATGLAVYPTEQVYTQEL